MRTMEPARKYRYSGGYGEVAYAQGGRLDDASVQRFIAAILDLPAVRWCSRQMEKETTAKPALGQADMERTRYVKIDARVRYNAARGVHQSHAEIVHDLGLPTTPPPVHYYSQRPAATAPAAPMDGRLLDRIKARAESNLKAGKFQTFDTIKYDLTH
jgi:hypothetical protein